jgi:ribose 5-phosphate isomerase B
MRIAVGSDHRGFHVRRRIISFLRERKHEVIDVGTETEESVDYPDIAVKVAQQVAAGETERGILICGTGLGMSIAANKIPGVRAATVHDDVTAELSRSHNDTNILCLSADLLGERLIHHIVDIWLKTEFEGGRHSRRVNKIREIETLRDRDKGATAK